RGLALLERERPLLLIRRRRWPRIVARRVQHPRQRGEVLVTAEAGDAGGAHEAMEPNLVPDARRLGADERHRAAAAIRDRHVADVAAAAGEEVERERRHERRV